LIRSHEKSPVRGPKRLEYKWIVGIIFVFGLFMDLLDMTITNVALPTLAERFDAGTTTIEWVVTGYLLALAVFIPVSGWVGDRFGTKSTFLFALTVFTAGSLLSGLAWNIESSRGGGGRRLKIGLGRRRSVLVWKATGTSARRARE